MDFKVKVENTTNKGNMEILIGWILGITKERPITIIGVRDFQNFGDQKQGFFLNSVKLESLHLFQ